MIRAAGSEIRLSVDRDGEKTYRNGQGQIHRLDAPVVEWPDGTMFWLVNGKLHRADGPAIEWSDGGQEWWLGGERHRVGGPAIEKPDGRKWWFLDGLPATEEEFLAGQRKANEIGVSFRRTRSRLW